MYSGTFPSLKWPAYDCSPGQEPLSAQQPLIDASGGMRVSCQDNVLADVTLVCGRRSGFEPGLSERGSRHLLELRHQGLVRVGPVADS